MARQDIPMVINLRQNKNSHSNGFGHCPPLAEKTAGGFYLPLRNAEVAAEPGLDFGDEGQRREEMRASAKE